MGTEPPRVTGWRAALIVAVLGGLAGMSAGMLMPGGIGWLILVSVVGGAAVGWILHACGIRILER